MRINNDDPYAIDTELTMPAVILMCCPTCGAKVRTKTVTPFVHGRNFGCWYPVPDCPDCPIPVCDEIGYGEATPEALRLFLRRAGLAGADPPPDDPFDPAV